MPRYILDTDTVEAIFNSHPHVLAHLALHSPNDVFVTIVTFQEQCSGWLAQLTRQQAPERYVWAYSGLRRTLDYFAQINILDFDFQAAVEYGRLRGRYRRLGTNDLRIAAITLTADAILVTRNVKDFSQIEGLQLEDWTQTLS